MEKEYKESQEQQAEPEKDNKDDQIVEDKNIERLLAGKSFAVPKDVYDKSP